MGQGFRAAVYDQHLLVYIYTTPDRSLSENPPIIIIIIDEVRQMCTDDDTSRGLWQPLRCAWSEVALYIACVLVLVHMLPSGNKKFCSRRGERASRALQQTKKLLRTTEEGLKKGLRRASEGLKKALRRP